MKHRIMSDRYSGYEVQVRRWWFPIWIQCWDKNTINTFSSIKCAKEFIQSKKLKRKEYWREDD